MRPASVDETCFYCHQPIGADHLEDCVLIQRTVKIQMTVVYDVKVPACWSIEQIESHRNDGSWCASNAIEELGEIPDCLCNCAIFKYVDGIDSKISLGEV